jgi:hypothetical protein
MSIGCIGWFPMTALLLIVTFAICLNVKRLFGSLVYERWSFGGNSARIVLVQTLFDHVVMMPSAP